MQRKGKKKASRKKHPTGENITNVDAVISPVMSVVHDQMKSAWKINRRNEMWLVFDAISPVRVFKGDMAYEDGGRFPVYTPEDA